MTHIFTAHPDGTGTVDLTVDDTSELSPRWSADGRKLAFNGFGVLRTITVGDPTRTVLSVAGCPAWSPDGTRIAFCREVQFFGASSDFDVFVMNADGTGIVNLIGDPPDSGPYDADPAWAPDGKRIAFSSTGRSGAAPGVYTIGPDGQGLGQVTSGYRDLHPNWSPHGSRIVFQRYRFDGDDAEVYVVNADGTESRQLTDNGTTDETPVWSPDGTKIAFGRENPRGLYDVWVMNADGSGETLLIADGRSPDWQPIPGPQRNDYKNAAQFCKAERDFLGDSAFRQKYGGGANAHGKCVSGK